MGFAVLYSARTDVGLVRSRNEDSGYAGPHLLAVCDGMGGHAGGNVASSIVLAKLAPLDGDSHGSDDALTLLEATIAEANGELAEAMESHPELSGMGTTLTALMRAGNTRLALVHIGDSRAYLLREGEFTQISKDHSFVQTLVDSGRITPEEAEHHPQRSLVTRVLTGSPEDEPDLSMREAHAGDRYLICSDGLSDYVAYSTIKEIITAEMSPEDTTARLIDLALKAGAPDNVTCVVGDIVTTDDAPPTQPSIVGAAAERHSDTHVASAASPAAKAAALRRSVTDTDGEGGDDLADDEEASPRALFARWLLVPTLILGALGIFVYAMWVGTSSQVYIGVNDGKVAVFRGVNQHIGPLSLSSLHETSNIDVADLPTFYQEQVRTASFTTGSLDEAQQMLTELSKQAGECKVLRQAGKPCGGET